MPTRAAEVQALDHGVHLIDTGFHRPAFDSCCLIVENGRAAFVDTGPNPAVPRLLAARGELALAPDAVDFVTATHVHLDHAGGASALMTLLPQARLAVHPCGAPHLISPRLRVQSAASVHGPDEFARSHGSIVPVARERVMQTKAGGEISLAGRPLRCLHTPGDTRHHHCIWGDRSRAFFTGDCFGLS